MTGGGGFVAAAPVSNRGSMEYREFAIPEMVSLSSLQFQVSHNTNLLKMSQF